METVVDRKREAADDTVFNIVEQLTLRKLDYARNLLKSAALPYSGTRPQVRERLVKAMENKQIKLSTLQTLLDELDMWGDQRIRVGRLATSSLVGFRTGAALRSKVKAAGMSYLLDGAIALVPPSNLTPMKILYEEQSGRRCVRLVAAKTRQVMVPQPDIPDHRDPQYPSVIFKPFRIESQKALAFAEIHLDTGLTFMSAT